LGEQAVDRTACPWRIVVVVVARGGIVPPIDGDEVQLTSHVEKFSGMHGVMSTPVG
jgi:hypothetical protein